MKNTINNRTRYLNAVLQTSFFDDIIAEKMLMDGRHVRQKLFRRFYHV